MKIKLLMSTVPYREIMCKVAQANCSQTIKNGVVHSNTIDKRTSEPITRVVVSTFSCSRKSESNTKNCHM